MADLLRTSNPALNDKIFQGSGVGTGEAMTLNGTVNKTGFLLLLVVASAAWLVRRKYQFVLRLVRREASWCGSC